MSAIRRCSLQTANGQFLTLESVAHCVRSHLCASSGDPINHTDPDGLAPDKFDGTVGRSGDWNPFVQKGLTVTWNSGMIQSYGSMEEFLADSQQRRTKGDLIQDIFPEGHGSQFSAGIDLSKRVDPAGFTVVGKSVKLTDGNGKVLADASILNDLMAKGGTISLHACQCGRSSTNLGLYLSKAVPNANVGAYESDTGGFGTRTRIGFGYKVYNNGRLIQGSNDNFWASLRNTVRKNRLRLMWDDH